MGCVNTKNANDPALKKSSAGKTKGATKKANVKKQTKLMQGKVPGENPLNGFDEEDNREQVETLRKLKTINVNQLNLPQTSEHTANKFSANKVLQTEENLFLERGAELNFKVADESQKVKGMTDEQLSEIEA